MWRVWVLLVGLVGCGGSDSTQRATVASYSDMHGAVVGMGVTPYSQVPSGGRHNYAGLMSLDVPFGSNNTATYLGDLQISIAMSGNAATATGTADNFARTGGALSGALAVSGGMIFPDADPDRDFLLRANLDGTLGHQGTDYVLDGTIVADFYGDNADAIAGLVFGNITQEGSVDIFDGSFAAEADP